MEGKMLLKATGIHIYWGKDWKKKVIAGAQCLRFKLKTQFSDDHIYTSEPQDLGFL